MLGVCKGETFGEGMCIGWLGGHGSSDSDE